MTDRVEAVSVVMEMADRTGVEMPIAAGGYGAVRAGRMAEDARGGRPCRAPGREFRGAGR